MIPFSNSGVVAATTAIRIEDYFRSTIYYRTVAGTQCVTSGINADVVIHKARTISYEPLWVDKTIEGKVYPLSGGTSYELFDGRSEIIDNGFISPLFGSNHTCVTWSFKKSPRFFDIVYYTGTGATQTFNHNLGVTPGMIVFKRLDSTDAWVVYNYQTGGTYTLFNSVSGSNGVGVQDVFNPQPNQSTFSVANVSFLNQAGGKFAAYLFAHDASNSGVIKTGRYVGNGTSDGPSVNLGWKPQWILIKNITGNGEWTVFDSNLFNGPVLDEKIYPFSATSSTTTANEIEFTSQGFKIKRGGSSSDPAVNAPGPTYMYMAIRAPNEPPIITSKDVNEVFSNVIVGGNQFSETPISIQADMEFQKGVIESHATVLVDSLRPEGMLTPVNTNSSIMYRGSVPLKLRKGLTSNPTSLGDHIWSFRRAKNFFDMVQYVGDGQDIQTIRHGLDAQPGFVFIKSTSNASEWPVYHLSLGTANNLSLSSSSISGFENFYPIAPSDKVISVARSANTDGYTYQAYIFANDISPSGMIRCGSYLPSTSPISIDLGWEPQWLLIKPINAGSPWSVITNTMLDSIQTLSGTSGAQGFSGFSFTSNGFTIRQGNVVNSTSHEKYIFVAIRKGASTFTPKTVDDVFNSSVYPITGNGSSKSFINTGFEADTIINTILSGSMNRYISDTINRGGVQLATDNSNITRTNPMFNSPVKNGIYSMPPSGTHRGITWSFKKYSKYFDNFKYTGLGGTQIIPHNLNAPVGLLLVKNITTASNWTVWHNGLNVGERMELNSNQPAITNDSAKAEYFGNNVVAINPTSSSFTVGQSASVNAANYQYMVYMWANNTEEDGFIKCGTYTPTSGLPTKITLGWEPQFILIKSVSSTGDWIVFDKKRMDTQGINGLLSLNNVSLAESYTYKELIYMKDGFETQITLTNLFNTPNVKYFYMAIRNTPTDI